MLVIVGYYPNANDSYVYFNFFYGFETLKILNNDRTRSTLIIK